MTLAESRDSRTQQTAVSVPTMKALDESSGRPDWLNWDVQEIHLPVVFKAKMNHQNLTHLHLTRNVLLGFGFLDVLGMSIAEPLQPRH